MKTTTIHTGHSVVLRQMTEEVNRACHGGEKKTFFVHLHDMIAGETYEIPAPDLDQGQCAFFVANSQGELFYHEKTEIIGFVPKTDIASDYGCWKVLEGDASLH